MKSYRVYVTDEQGQFRKVHLLPECGSDEEAMTAAEQYLDGSDVEVWERARRVGAIRSVEGKVVRELD